MPQKKNQNDCAFSCRPPTSISSICVLPELCYILKDMVKAILIITLLSGLAWADEASGRVAITRTVAAAAKADAKTADLVTDDFDGELVKLPAARPWCELDCPRLSLGTVRFVTPDVALVEGTASGDGVVPGAVFIAVLKKVGENWRIASMRLVVPRTPFAMR